MAERKLVVDTAHSPRNPLAALAVRLQALQPMIAQDHAAATFAGVVSEVDRLAELLDGLLTRRWPMPRTAARPCARTRRAVTRYRWHGIEWTRGTSRSARRDAHTASTVSHECEAVAVSVRDDGVGVSPDELDQLTTRFFRGA